MVREMIAHIALGMCMLPSYMCQATEEHASHLADPKNQRTH